MKKVVRMLGLCALVALAFTACKKDDTKKVTFTANLTQPTSADRTHAFGYGEYLVWNAGDQIKVFNAAGENQDFALPTDLTDLGRQVTFEVAPEKVDFLQDLATDNAYTAFYPAAEIEGSRVKMVIPANQVYEPGRNFDNNLYPMYAHNQGDNFVFTSHAGFLNLQFTCPRNQTISIKKIVLTSKDADYDRLSGNVYYNMDGSNYVFEGDGNEITMEFAPVALNYTEAKDFTFVLPQDALWSGFDVEVTDTDDNVYPFEAPGGDEAGNNYNYIEAMTYRVMTPKQVGTSTALQIHMDW